MSNVSAGRSVMVQGRIVWTSGDLFKGKPKVHQQTKQPVISTITGQQVIEYGFGLAVPKSVFAQMGPGQAGEIWAAMHEEAYTILTNRPPQIPASFSMKKKDGDTDIDDKGVPYSQREGYAGCIVLACTTTLPIKFFRFENGQNFQVNEGIKCGDYVNVQVHVKAHPAIGQGKAGLYLNPNAVQFLGYGKEIVNTPSGDQIFGTQAPMMPQGASAMPIAPTGMIVPQGQPAPMQAPAFQPQAPMMPSQPAPAHHGVLPPAFQPQAPMGNGQPAQQGIPQASGFAPQAPQYGGPMLNGQSAAQPAYPSNPMMPQMPTGMPTYQQPR